MKNIKFYEFAECNTCKRALKFLTNRRYAVDRIAIFQNPPSKAEIQKMIEYYGGNFHKLLTPAAKRNEETGLAESAGMLSEKEVVEMLSANGKLFRRPFVLTDTFGLVGFDESAWEKRFPK